MFLSYESSLSLYVLVPIVLTSCSVLRTVCVYPNEITVCISSSLLGIKTLEKILLSCSTIHEDCVYCMGITYVWYCLLSLLLDNSLICGAL